MSRSRKKKNSKKNSQTKKSKKRNNFKWIFIGLVLIFISGIIYKYPSPPPPPSDETIYITYYYNHSNPRMSEANNMENSLKEGVKLLNRLSKLLKINKNFKIFEFANIDSDTLNRTKLFQIRNNTSPQKNVRIFIDNRDFKFIPPHYDPNLDFICLRYKERFDPVILLHEICHKITNNKIPHTVIDNITTSCIISDSSGCKNLMAKENIYPFNYLITESQRTWIDSMNYNRRNCTGYHVYPEEVINHPLANEISCCNKQKIISENMIRTTLKETHGDEIPDDYIKNILSEVEKLQSKKVCPTLMSISDIGELRNFTSNIVSLRHDDGTVVALAMVQSNQLNFNIYADISRIYKKSFNYFTKPSFDAEAKILTKGTGVSSSEFSLMRRTNSNAKLLAKQKIIDDQTISINTII